MTTYTIEIDLTSIVRRYVRPRFTKGGDVILESSNNKKFRKRDIKTHRPSKRPASGSAPIVAFVKG